MKKLFTFICIFIAFAASSQITVPIGNTVVIGGSSGAYTPVTTAQQITDAGADANIEIRADIDLGAGFTAPANQTWYFTLGSVSSTGTIDLNGGKWYNNGNELAFDVGTTGSVTNSDPPPYFYASNFGVQYDAVKVFSDANITTGTTTLTTTTTTFTVSDVGKEIAVVGAVGPTDAGEPFGRVLKTTIASFTNGNSVELTDAASATVSNQNFMYGTENYNRIFQATSVRNTEAGVLEFLSDGIAGYNTVTRTPDLTAVPTGILLGNNTDGVHFVNNATLKLFPHDLDQSHGISAYRTEGSTFTGSGAFEGEFDLNPQANDKGEHNHGFAMLNLANNGKVQGLKLRYWHGDALYGQGNPQRQNQIDGANFVDGSTDSQLAQGHIDDTGTIDTGNTDYAYTTSFLSIDNGTFDNITSRNLKRWFALTGGSFGNWGGMKTPYYWVAYYDASDTFIFRTPKLRWYDRIIVPFDNAAKVRVMIENSSTLADVQVELRPDLRPSHWEISGNTINGNGREGISNPPDFLEFHHNEVYNNGDPILAAGPGFGYNAEDGGQIIQYQWIFNNHFYNNWGGISLKNTTHVWVYNNKFGVNHNDLSAAPTNDIEVGVNAGLSYNTQIYNNNSYYVQNSVGRNSRYTNNTQIGGRFTMGSSGAVIKNNEFENVAFRAVEDAGSDRLGHNDDFSFNRIYISEKMVDYLWEEDEGLVNVHDNLFQWNWAGQLRPDLESTDLDIVIAGSDLGETVNRLFLRGTQTIDYGATWKNNTFKGLTTISDTSGSGTFPVNDYKGGEYGVSMTFNEGLKKDFTLEDMTINGWLHFELAQFGDVLTGTPAEVLIKDTDVIIDNRFSWSNNGSTILETEAKDFNLTLDNVLLKIEPSYTLVNTNKFWDLEHLGTVTLKDVTIETSLTGWTLDLTASSVSASVGTITFIDPDLDFDDDGTDDVTVTPRAGDVFLFTRSSPSLKTYASFVDDAAAIAAGIPQTGTYQYYNTTDSNIQILD